MRVPGPLSWSGYVGDALVRCTTASRLVTAVPVCAAGNDAEPFMDLLQVMAQQLHVGCQGSRLKHIRHGETPQHLQDTYVGRPTASPTCERAPDVAVAATARLPHPAPSRPSSASLRTVVCASG